MCSRTRGAEKWREARKRENIQVREGRIDAGSERNRGGGERGEQQNDLGAANNKPYALTPGRFTPRTYVCTRTRSQCLVSYPRCRYNATLLRCYREQRVPRRGYKDYKLDTRRASPNNARYPSNARFSVLVRSSRVASISVYNSTSSLFSCVIEPSESTLLFRVDCCTILFFFFCFLADKNKNLEQFLKFDRADIELRHGTKRLDLDLVHSGWLVSSCCLRLTFIPSSFFSLFLFSLFLSFVRASLRREENDLGITGTG